MTLQSHYLYKGGEEGEGKEEMTNIFNDDFYIPLQGTMSKDEWEAVGKREIFYIYVYVVCYTVF